MEDREIKAMVDAIVDAENCHDGSMEFYYLERVFKFYMERKGIELYGIFREIFDAQSEKSASYGDLDFHVRKLSDKTVKSPDHFVDFAGSKLNLGGQTYRTVSMYLRDNPSTSDITEWVLTMKEMVTDDELGELPENIRSKFKDIQFSIVAGGPKSKPIYWDCRDEGHTLGLRDRGYGLEDVDFSGHAARFRSFVLCLRALRSVYFCVTREK